MRSRWVLLLLVPALFAIPPVAAQAAAPACFGIPATIVGTAGNDVLVGTSDSDVIVAKSGDDTIRGMDEYDTICGGRGDDIIRTGDGPDDSKGGPGNDQIYAQGSDLFAFEAMYGNGGPIFFMVVPRTPSSFTTALLAR
jgi:hypothetical protein